jgi:RNA polymerase sigma-70 factor (ECF subfamily)
MGGERTLKPSRSDPSLTEEADFAYLVEPHRKELQLHCYRMLGSVADAEDLAQETMLRAWRFRASYRGGASIRTWLYRIATNACLDQLRRRPRRLLPQGAGSPAGPEEPLAAPITDLAWLEPYPDELLPDPSGDPEARYAMRESVSLAFTAALQRLPPRQRAALILCDVLDWAGEEAAEALETTLPAVNSALYRARTTLRAAWASPVPPPPLDVDARLLLDRYVEAWHRADVDDLVKLLVEDALLAMPPTPSWFAGRQSLARVFSTVAFAPGQGWKLVATGSNLQPAFVFYGFDPEGGSYRAAGVQVITLRPSGDGPRVAEIIAFMQPELARRFRHPPTLPSATDH